MTMGFALRAGLGVLLALVGTCQSAAASSPSGAVRNVELVGTLPEATRAISLAFLEYAGGRDVMLVSTQDGLRSYDLTGDPARPRPLDVLTNEELMLPGDQPDALGRGFWENEDMDVDPARKLAFLSRDSTAFSSAATGVYIVDAADPADLRPGRFVPLPTGHTTTCINECDYLWTAGYGARAEVWVTDVRDPALPVPSPLPVVTESRTQTPGSVPPGSHDVQVDGTGVAWVSGTDAIRGYWTAGSHADPQTGQTRDATPTAPIAYGGGTVPRSEGELSRFMHNSARSGDLLLGTEEVITECAGAGELVISSLAGHTDGNLDGALQTVGTWSPSAKEGQGPAGTCSAHYFDRAGDVLVQSYYAQGTRFLDVRDPANPIQIAYFRPDDGASWQPRIHRGLVYVADNRRGIDILRLQREETVVRGTPGGSPAPRGARCRETIEPVSRLNANGLRLTRRRVTLRGHASDRLCPAARDRVAGVQVAIARVSAGQCAFLRRNRRLGRPRSCRRPVWLRARGTSSWVFSMAARLPRGSYSAMTRAVSRTGTPGPSESARLAARRRGEVRAEREIFAPPLDASTAGRFTQAYQRSPTWGFVCPLPRR